MTSLVFVHYYCNGENNLIGSNIIINILIVKIAQLVHAKSGSYRTNNKGKNIRENCMYAYN